MLFRCRLLRGRDAAITATFPAQGRRLGQLAWNATPIQRRGIMQAMRSMSATAKVLMLLAGVFCVLPGSHLGHAAVSDPAAVQVQTLSDALLKSMRAGSSESMADRYRALEPVIE